MSKSPFVTQIKPSIAKEIQYDLEEQGFAISKKPYMLFCAQKKGLSLSAYESGKLVVQGSNIAEFMEFYLEPKLGLFTFTNPHLDLDTSPRIGADESGKGDFFGPLTVAAVFADSAAIEELAHKGIKDSKTLSDKKIEEFSKIIEAKCLVESLSLFPEKYNELYPKFGNLNTMLAWAHATCISKLLAHVKTEAIIVDKFANDLVILRAFAQKRIEIKPILRCKAESDVVVAAASLIARNNFVKGIGRLSEALGIKLPKGGSVRTTQVGKQIGRERLGTYAKLHFKNASEIN